MSEQLPQGIRIENGRYHIRFQHGGQRHQQSTGLKATGRNLKRAERILHQMRAALESGAPIGRRRAMPFNDAVASYNDWARGEMKRSTAERIRVSTVSLRVFFGSLPIHGVTAGNIEDYKAARRAAEIKEVTIRHDLHALSGLLQYAQKHGWCLRNVTEDVSIPSDRDATRQNVLDARQEMLYFSAAAQYPILYDAGRLMLLTGMRPDEVLNLWSEDFDARRKTITVRGGKTPAARRTLALDTESAAIVRQRSTGGFLFRGTRGAKPKLQRWHNAVLAELRKAGTPVECVPYDFRHTYATRMAERGCPIPLLSAILGHANLRTISRYVHPSADSAVEAMRQYGEDHATFTPHQNAKGSISINQNQK